METTQKSGIQVTIPGLGELNIHHLVTDYTGTLSCNGQLSEGVRALLTQLAQCVDIHVLTSDTFGTAGKQLEGLPLYLHLLADAEHDRQKEAFVQKLGPRQVAAFGNGNNDRKMLRAVREAGGLAVAVDNGEGCALDALTSANLAVHGAVNALSLLTNTKRVTATLRF